MVVENWKNRVGVFVIVMLFFCVLNFEYTRLHEKAHHQIYEYWGVNSTVEVKWFGLGGGTTTPDFNQTRLLSDTDRFTLSFLHSLNEVVGYPIQMIIYVLAFIGLVIARK